jgi:hypothetical protein
MSLDTGFATPIQISTTLWSYIRPVKGGTKPPRSLPTDIGLCHKKIVCKVDDPAAQRIHNKNADRMLLASFVAGLAGVAGRQTRFSNPQSLDEALKIALTVQEAEKQSLIQLLHLWNSNPTVNHEQQLSIAVRFSCDPHTQHMSITKKTTVSRVQQMSITTNPTVIHKQHVAYPVLQILLLPM